MTFSGYLHMETALQIVLQQEYNFLLFRLHPIGLLGSHAGPTNQPAEPICLICAAQSLILIVFSIQFTV